MDDYYQYGSRNEVLLALGYSSYEDYLGSELWAGIRERVLTRDGHKCRLCDKRAATCIHHIDYSRETMLGEKIDLMYSLCYGCHQRLEFDSTAPGRKLKFSSVVSKTLRLMKAKGKKPRGKPWIGLRHRDKWRRRRGGY